MTETVTEWAASLQIKPCTVHNRIRAGWPLCDVLTLPARSRKNAQGR